jgi:hypothetical protein
MGMHEQVGGQGQHQHQHQHQQQQREQQSAAQSVVCWLLGCWAMSAADHANMQHYATIKVLGRTGFGGEVCQEMGWGEGQQAASSQSRSQRSNSSSSSPGRYVLLLL